MRLAVGWCVPATVALRQVVALADLAPTLTDAQLRARLVTLAGRLR